MRNRILSALLAICFIVMLLPNFAVAATEFTDMPNDYSTTSLEASTANGLLNGSDGKIMPNDSLTRAQMAVIISRAFGATQQASLATYSDVSTSAWYFADMGKAVQMKVLTGNNGLLKPNDSISRQEAFAVLARALKLENGTAATLDAFTDKADVSSWAVGSTAAMISNGYIHGTDSKINPQADISRKDFAVMMNNIIRNYIKTAGTVTTVAEGSVMVNVPNVTLQNVTVKGDLIIGDGVGSGNITLDNVKVEGKTIVRGGGVNSFIVKGNSTLGTVTIAKVDGNIRVFVDSTASVEVVEIKDGKDDVLVEGTIAKLSIATPEVPVSIQHATIKEVSITAEKANVTIAKDSKVTTVATEAANTALTVAGAVETLTATKSADGAKIKVSTGATIGTVNAAAAKTEITGDGSVKNANVTADSVKVDTVGTQLTVGTGINGTTSGGKAIEAGTTTKTETSSSGGGGGGGGDTTVAVSAITVTPTTMTLTAGGSTGTITKTISPANATNQNVTWASSNTAVATVVNGVVTPVAAGTATITVTSAANTSKTATCTVTVTVPVSAITVTPTTMTLTVGGSTGTITKTISPANATNQNVTWASSDIAVATVVGGVVTPVAAGTATITVTSTADNSKTATCTVTVTQVSTSAQLATALTNAKAGDTISVAAGTYADDITIDKAVTIQGVGDTTIFTGGITVSSDNVSLKNFKLSCGSIISNTNLKVGITVSDIAITSMYIANVTVEKYLFGMSSGDTNKNVKLSGLIVENCIFQDNILGGFYAVNLTDSTFKNSQFLNHATLSTVNGKPVSGTGIYLNLMSSVENTKYENIVIDGCTFTNNGKPYNTDSTSMLTGCDIKIIARGGNNDSIALPLVTVTDTIVKNSKFGETGTSGTTSPANIVVGGGLVASSYIDVNTSIGNIGLNKIFDASNSATEAYIYKDSSMEITDSTGTYYLYKAVVDGEVGTIKFDAVLAPLLSVGGNDIGKIWLHDGIVSTYQPAFVTPITKLTGSNVKSPTNGVIGLGYGNYNYTASTLVFYVKTASDGTVTVKKSTVASIATDANDTFVALKSTTGALIALYIVSVPNTVDTVTGTYIFDNGCALVTDSTGTYYVYNAVVNGAVTTVKVAQAVVDASGSASATTLGLFGNLLSSVTYTNGIITSVADYSGLTLATSGAGLSGTGLTMATNGVIGLTGHGFYGYSSNVVVFYVTKNADGSFTIAPSSILAVSTDSDDAYHAVLNTSGVMTALYVYSK